MPGLISRLGRGAGGGAWPASPLAQMPASLAYPSSKSALSMFRDSKMSLWLTSV